MGYSLLRLVRPVDPHLRCPICSGLLEAPVLTACGHTFCQACLLTWLYEGSVSGSSVHLPHAFDHSQGTPNPEALSLTLSHQPHSATQSGGNSGAHSMPPYGDVPSHSSPLPPPSLQTSYSQPSVPGPHGPPEPTGQLEHRPAPHPWSGGTCPECRAPVSPDDLSPVICLRNLILALEVRCEHADRGCPACVPLEEVPRHLQTCGFAPVACFGCDEKVNSSQLADHQASCPVVEEIIRLGDADQHVSGGDGQNRCGNSIGGNAVMSEDASGMEAEAEDAANQLSIQEKSSTLGDSGTCIDSRVETSSRGRNNKNSSSNNNSRNNNTNDNSNGGSRDGGTSPVAALLSRTSLSIRSTSVPRRSKNATIHDGRNSETIANSPHTSLLPGNHNSNNSSSSPTRRTVSPQLLSSQVSSALAQASCAAHVSRLLTRIGALETQVGKLLDDLQEANSKNSQLNTEYRRIKKELRVYNRDKGVQAVFMNACGHSDDDDETDRDIGLSQLSMSMARNLLDKPDFIDSTVVFRRLRSCYVENFLSGSVLKRNRGKTHDIHVLLATAYASNWFTHAQRTSLGLWLQHVLLDQGRSRADAGFRYSF